jgi:hypothetical protein
LLLLANISCNENFPTYEEPKNILVSELSFASNDTISMVYDGLTQMYFMNDQMVFTTSVTNVFDDLLQGAAKVEGKITIQSFSEFPRVLVVQLTRGELRTPPIFQGNMALAPSKSAEFSTLWYPKAVDGNMVFADLPFTGLNGSKLYGPVKFQAQSTIQIFERLQPVKSNVLEFTLWFKVNEN